MTESMWLPSLSHFQNGNGWAGSQGLLRFQLEPPTEGKITVVLWQDPFTRQYAEELGRSEFDATDEGLEALAHWLCTQADEMSAHPPRTPAQLLAYRNAKILSR